MEAQDILKTLNNLEESLNNVESARLQVTNTVNAYESAKAQFQGLAMEFTVVSTELKNVYTAIKENVCSIDHTIQDKIEDVFNNITKKAQELEDAAKNVQLAFEATCNQVARSIEDSIDNRLLKLNDEMEASVVKFNKKATHEIEGIATALTTFKVAAQQMKEGFGKTITEASASLKATQESIAADFGTSISEHLSSYNSLKTELKSIIDEYEETNNSFVTKVENVSDLVKDESTSITTAIQSLQTDRKTDYEDLVAKLKSLSDGYIKAADNLSERFNSVDIEIGKLSSSIHESKDRMDYASSLIIKAQKETVARVEKQFVDEIASLKKEIAKNKKFTAFCLITIIISLILNFMAIIR